METTKTISFADWLAAQALRPQITKEDDPNIRIAVGGYREYHMFCCKCGKDLGWWSEVPTSPMCSPCQKKWQAESDAEHIRSAAESLRRVRAGEDFDEHCQ